MRHPNSRGERRAVRDSVIERRKFIWKLIWWRPEQWREEQQWGRFAKYNLGCGSKRCHYLKYFGPKRQRRRALDQAVIDNIESFEEVAL